MGAFNAPLPWIKECVEDIDADGEYRRKILVGMNFYGRYIPNVKQQGNFVCYEKKRKISEKI